MIDERFYSTLTAVFVVTAISISIFFRSRATMRSEETYRQKQGGPGLIAIRLTFALSMVSFLVAYAVNPAWVNWASMGLPDWLRIAGGALVLIAIPNFVWMFRHLGKNITPTADTRTDHTLVVSGPYRWVRHPLYTVAIAFWLGISLFTAKWILLGLVGLMVVFLMIRTPREEANLLERFGDEYRDYRSRTGRYIPKLFG